MQALGLIETKGLLAAIECADVMLKAAQVSLVERTIVGGGLVTITVTGDVGSVKAAVEAGAAAVEQLDRASLVSCHIIPRPHREIEGIVGAAQKSPSVRDDGMPLQKDAGTSAEDTQSCKETAFAAVPQNPGKELVDEPASVSLGEAEPANETENQSFGEPEAAATFSFADLKKDKMDELIRQYGMEDGIKMLQTLSVVKLRMLARDYGSLKIKGREISKAGKELLIKTLREHYDGESVQTGL